MAIVSNSGGNVSRSVSATGMTTIGSTGSPILTPATTNRKKRGRGTVKSAQVIEVEGGSNTTYSTAQFQLLDSLILSFDAIFEMLPP